MPTIAEVRQKYPQYQDLSDDALADALHKKFYSDMPVDDFKSRIGLSVESDVSRNLRSELSAMTQNPAKAQYDALPAWKKPLVAASDIADLTANGLTMGWGNKAAAAARSMGTGNSYEAELADMQRQTQGARRRAGGAGDVAEIAGGLKTALLTAGGGLTLAGAGGTGAMTGLKGLALRSLLMGGEGAAYGAVAGAGNAKAGNELADAQTGAGYGALAGAGGNVIGEGISAGLNKVGGMFNKAPPRVTVDELKGTASAAYKKAADAGVMFNQNGVNTLRSNIIEDLTQRAFDPANEPGVMPVIKRLQAMGDGNVTLEGLESLRKVASNGYRPGMKSNNAAIGAIVNRIDDVVNAADPSMITMGNDPAAAASALNEARSYWGRARRLETVEGLVNKGELIGGSQKNQDIAGATKRQLRTILTSEGKARGFSKPEMEELRNVVLGTPGKRTLDAISGMLPTGRLGGLAQGSIGAANLATGNVAGLALQGAGMAAGYGAQKAGDAMNRKAVEKLTDLVARGGVVPAASKNALQRLSESKRDALIRLIMGAGINQTVTP